MNKKMGVLALALLPRLVTSAEPLAGCAAEADDRLRLACYDSAYTRLKAGSETVSDVKVDAQVVTSDSQRESSVMSKTRELGPSDKRNTFVVRTYLPNFLLPLHYTSNINRTPHSPTQQADAANRDYRSIEAKLQLSLRAKVVEDLFLPGADLWAAYTQRSLWQLWDAGDSSPFRSTDYQPEMIYVVPVHEGFGKMPLGWSLRMLQLGFAHQSNGQSNPLSRSWNRITLGAGFEHGDFSLMIRDNQRVHIQSKDDNPDLTDYIGRGEINMAWSPGVSTMNLTWRTNFKSLSRGSLQLDWTYPVFADQPTGLRWYPGVTKLGSSELLPASAAGNHCCNHAAWFRQRQRHRCRAKESIPSRNHMNKLNINVIAISVVLAFSSAAMAEGMSKTDYKAAHANCASLYSIRPAACSFPAASVIASRRTPSILAMSSCVIFSSLPGNRSRLIRSQRHSC